jgi:hypothetical protein
MTGSLVDVTGQAPFQWTGPQAEITVSNLGSTPARATLTMVIAGNGGASRTVSITAPGTSRRLTVSAGQSTTVTLPLLAEPGSTAVRLAATGDAVAVPGTQGKTLAVLKVAQLVVATEGPTNAASLQQFAFANPRSQR